MTVNANIPRYVTLALALGVGVWLLWPPAEERGTQAKGSARRAAAREVQYVIRFAPGQQYLPGMIPYGIGAPLEGMAEVARAFEERFPDTRIEFVNVPLVREYIVTQLSSGLAPDIINVNVEDVWTDIQKGWYAALDPFLERPNPFVVEKGDPAAPGYNQWWDMFKYQAISRGKAAPDGLNYCFTFDLIETGIFYNKNIFAKVGVAPPRDWDEFLVLLERVQRAGYLPMVMHIDWFTDWTADLFFDQLYYSLLPGIDLVQDPIREPYMQGYLDWDELCFLFQKGFFHADDPRYREMWRLMKEFRQYCSKDLGAPGRGDDQIRDFVTQRAAMIWNPSVFAYRLAADRDLEFGWDIFYLPRFTKKTSKWASDVEMCVIGGSATQLEVTNSAFSDTGDPASSKRLERVIAFLQFLSLPENYARVVNEYPSLLPNIVGVDALPLLEPFERILERRYTTTKWVFTFDLRFAEIQRRMLEMYLNGGIDLDGFMAWQEDNLRSATENLVLRKEIDFDRLEKAWAEKAAIRAAMEGIPHG